MNFEEKAEFLRQHTAPVSLRQRTRKSLSVPKVLKDALPSKERESEWDFVYGHEKITDEVRNGFGDALGELSQRKRKNLIKVLLPGLVQETQQALEAMEVRTYGKWANSRPFRCPQSSVQLDRMRASFLVDLAVQLGDFEVDLSWLISHQSKLDGLHEIDLGWLYAGAIDLGGPKGNAVLEQFSDILAGEHPNARVSDALIHGCLCSNVPEAWELIEKTLLAAQRQEGLRQSILECVDEAHPEAFLRMLRLILEHKLYRFSSVVRAVDTWFGCLWNGEDKWKVEELIVQALDVLGSEASRAAAIASDDPQSTYMGLWAFACHDVDVAVEKAIALLAHPDASHRFAALHLLVESVWSTSHGPIVESLADADIRVVELALTGLPTKLEEPLRSQAYDSLERLLDRLPEKRITFQPLLWPWMGSELLRSEVVENLFYHLTRERFGRFRPFIGELSASNREDLLRWLTGVQRAWESPELELKEQVEPAYGVVIEFLGDASTGVRHLAFASLKATPVREPEIQRLIELLRRTASDLRTFALQRLWLLPDDSFVVAMRSLSEESLATRRMAGLELARRCVEDGRTITEAKQVAADFRERRKKLSEGERSHLSVIEQQGKKDLSLDDCLGLIDPSDLRRWPLPSEKGRIEPTKASIAALESICATLLQHSDEEFPSIDWDGAETSAPLLHCRHPLFHTVYPSANNKNQGRSEQAYPLYALWQDWLADRPDKTKDKDGLELARLTMLVDWNSDWIGPAAKELFAMGSAQRHGKVGFQAAQEVVLLLLRGAPPAGLMELCLGQLEWGFSYASVKELKAGSDTDDSHAVFTGGLDFLETGDPMRIGYARSAGERLKKVRSLTRVSLTPAESVRLYTCLRWYVQESKQHPAFEIDLDGFLAALAGGAFQGDAQARAEFLHLLIGSGSRRRRFALLRETCDKTAMAKLKGNDLLFGARQQALQILVDVECDRGDLPCAATECIPSLSRSGGLPTLKRALPALGKATFRRNTDWLYEHKGLSKGDSLSRLIRRSAPEPEDTPEVFRQWVKEAGIKESRIVELGMYAPQWADHVEHALGWKGYAGAVWWIYAHTRDDQWDIREQAAEWAAKISESTPITSLDLMEGAVDVQWFHVARKSLGTKRWGAVFKAAKFASSNGGHTRAQLFASTMDGSKKLPEILKRIDEKRHQDSVRAIGLIPLRRGKLRQTDLLSRYERFAKFLVESKKFGSQRKANEARAVATGLANLARTAGFRDPLRLSWAMELEAVRDLCNGPVVAEQDEVCLTLRVNEEGQPHLDVTRAGKSLKSVPRSHSKIETFVALKGRAKQLRIQASRVRETLETSMVRGDTYGTTELLGLFSHPVLGPRLQRVIFFGPSAMGYPVLAKGAKLGLELLNVDGERVPVDPDSELRMAHPADLLERGEWSAWQTECFANERTQPFKQVFRELYPPTHDELKEGLNSRRYAGHQVNPRQSLALLGQRGWVLRPEEGLSKTFHDADVVAWVILEEHFHTAAEVEGLTLDQVCFMKRSTGEVVHLEDLPARLFSEVMRDLDLVVSVAHMGGVDPEATASTIEMRAALLRETCRLLKLDNVEVKQQNAFIEGSLAQYAVHLGSAQASVRNRLALAITAVHSQHRGRVFLPFADNDPRTAEVLAKVLLLARDGTIQDPSILRQIQRA